VKTKLYILDDANNVIALPITMDSKENVLKCGMFMEQMERRRVGDTTVGNYRISTVFLGLDHGFSLDGEEHTPILFETMVFSYSNEVDKLHDLYQDRYATWDEAVVGHKAVVKLICNTLS